MTDRAVPPVVEGVEWVRPRPPHIAYRNDIALARAAGTAVSVPL